MLAPAADTCRDLFIRGFQRDPDSLAQPEQKALFWFCRYCVAPVACRWGPAQVGGTKKRSYDGAILGADPFFDKVTASDFAYALAVLKLHREKWVGRIAASMEAAAAPQQGAREDNVVVPVPKKNVLDEDPVPVPDAPRGRGRGSRRGGGGGGSSHTAETAAESPDQAAGDSAAKSRMSMKDERSNTNEQAVIMRKLLQPADNDGAVEDYDGEKVREGGIQQLAG